jgi:5-methylcytosine-specific restriction protein A
MKYPFSAYSWEVLSNSVAVKRMDKSAFLHHGTGVPKEIAFFFNLPEGGLSEPMPVILAVGDVQHEAHFQMDAQFERFRLFWKSDFSTLIKQRFPSFYDIYASDEDDDGTKPPQMCFRRLRPDAYLVEFIEAPEPEPVGGWTDEELGAAVGAYFQMLNKESRGEAYNKAEVNRELRASALSNRSKGSVEFRMQNISAILMKLCHPIIRGYLPRGNVGTTASKRIKGIIFQKQLLRENDYTPTADDEELNSKVKTILKKGVSGKPTGQRQPKKKQSSQVRYERDPLVKAWVLQNANGTCELCDERGPFKDKNGDFFLEVHHVLLLADDGPDTTDNAVALCPNCHKKCHHSEDTVAVAQELRKKIDRIQ